MFNLGSMLLIILPRRCQMSKELCIEYKFLKGAYFVAEEFVHVTKKTTIFAMFHTRDNFQEV